MQWHTQHKKICLIKSCDSIFYPFIAATCSYIVSREGSVKRVCEVCSAIGPEHIRLEGSRLLAAIIKNCQNKGRSTRCVNPNLGRL